MVPFSFETAEELHNLLDCHITWTTAETKRVILENLHRSPLYGGKIEGVGPRYCPSIEDKIVRFADKERHQVFIEPCGLHTDEMYLQGLSSSLPVDVQLKLLRTIPGLERVKVMRPAYAIEYDCCDPLQLDATLEFWRSPGFTARASSMAAPDMKRRRPGTGSGSQRRPEAERTVASAAGQGFQLYWYAHRRSGNQRLLRSLPHDDLPFGIPAGAAAG